MTSKWLILRRILKITANIGVGFLVAGQWLYIALSGLPDAFAEKRYEGYVMDYLPAQKRATGQWPSSQRDITRSIRIKLSQDPDAPALREMLRYLQENPIGFEVIRKDKNNLRYHLRLKYETVTWDANINDGQ